MESPKYHLNAVVCLLVPSIWDIAYNQLQSKGFGFGNRHDVHRWSQRTVCWLYHMIASSPYAAASHLAYVYNYSVCLSRNKEALNIHCVPTPTPLFLVDSKVFLRTSNPPESFFLFLLLEQFLPLTAAGKRHNKNIHQKFAFAGKSFHINHTVDGSEILPRWGW